ncbi:ABC transporter permease [Kurthia gibsonii]|uniref:ABC transporter permease n=1 Tax=Kurthia gibsonii TaxID=33946 RepID=UPI001143DAD0|nr:ABC transporter permease [Kurthia gibsonii]GED19383.1 amino acid ABC transporter permease [Kurthia gibsonii]
MENMNTFQQFFYYFDENGSYVFMQFVQHFLISIYGVLIAAVVGIPTGILISKYGRLSTYVITIANIIQTIPGLAMLAILMLAIGLGQTTVVVAVFLYSLLPIIKNTYTGINNINKDLTDSGKGMGMTKLQVLYMIELPLSLSVIIAGIRIALVVAIGITAIGAFIGAGGLGDIIIRGTNATDGTAIILAGAIPTALMAVLVDLILSFIERKIDPVKKNRKLVEPKIESLEE